MKKRPLVAGALVACALTVAAPAVTAAAPAVPGGVPAEALRGWECPEDARGCLWDEFGGTGDVYVVRECGEYYLPPEWRDRTSSYQIMSAYELGLYNTVWFEPEFRQSLHGTGGPPGQGADVALDPNTGDDNTTDYIEVRCTP